MLFNFHEVLQEVRNVFKEEIITLIWAFIHTLDVLEALYFQSETLVPVLAVDR